MRRLRIPRLVPLAPLACLAAITIPAAHAQPPCWNPQIGPNLYLTDDSLAVGLALPFAFPMPGGGTTTSIDVSSNGFVYLVSGASTNAGCCAGSPSVLSSGPPRIAAAWTDLNPSAGGTVCFNATATEAVITWLDVEEYGAGGTNAVQLVLQPSGAFTVTWLRATIPGKQDLLVGCSPGGGASVPAEVDLSAGPTASAGVPTHYELFTAGAEPRDLVGVRVSFQPDGSGGYDTTPLSPCANFVSYGEGCPAPPTFYELFDGVANPNDLAGLAYLVQQNGKSGLSVATCAASCFESNYTNNLPLGNNATAVGLPLGFSFPLPGSPAGSTTAIDVCADGYIWLVSSAGATSDYTESVPEFLVLRERLAVLWDDLDPSAGGGVYFDAFPGRAVVTWAAVPEDGVANANTMQVQLFANGDMILYWDAGNTITDGLVGYSPGNNAPDPGARDLTASVPFDTGLGGVPLDHYVGGSTLAVPGRDVSFELGSLHPATVAAIMLIGNSQLNVPLSVIGMEGCYLLNSADAIGPMLINGGTAAISVRVPNRSFLIGGQVWTQGMVLAPGTTTLGALSSNGLAHTIGN